MNKPANALPIAERLRIYLSDERHIYKGSHAMRRRSASRDFEEILSRHRDLLDDWIEIAKKLQRIEAFLDDESGFLKVVIEAKSTELPDVANALERKLRELLNPTPDQERA